MCRAYGAWRICVIVYPTLTRWANLCRAYGARFAGPDPDFYSPASLPRRATMEALGSW